MSVRNRLAWIGGALGGLAAVRLLRRRAAAAPVPEPAPDPRADELRRKLDESKPLVDEREEFEAAETHVDEAEAARALDERRRDVRDRGRAAVERMRGGSTEEG